MMHSMSAGSAWIAILVMAVWIAAIGGAAWAAVRLVNRPHPRPVSPPSPLDILERRYAEGKITQEDFDEARARLREHQLDI